METIAIFVALGFFVALVTHLVLEHFSDESERDRRNTMEREARSRSWADDQQRRAWERQDEVEERDHAPVSEEDFRSLQAAVIKLQAQAEEHATQLAFKRGR